MFFYITNFIAPANISSHIRNTIGNETYGASFTCSVTGIPRPSVTWSRIESGEEITISNSEKFVITSSNMIEEYGVETVTSELMIMDLTVSDELTYLCRGRNDVENVIGAVNVSSASLTVQS